MDLKQAQPVDITETKALGSLEGGSVFRFSHISFEDALNEGAFYMILDNPSEKKGILIANMKDGKQLLRDSDHRVIHHHANLSLTP